MLCPGSRKLAERASLDRQVPTTGGGSDSTPHVETVVAQLQKHYPTVVPESVTAIVRRHFARFDGRPVLLYVPLLVERRSRDELEQLQVRRV